MNCDLILKVRGQDRFLELLGLDLSDRLEFSLELGSSYFVEGDDLHILRFALQKVQRLQQILVAVLLQGDLVDRF